MEGFASRSAASLGDLQEGLLLKLLEGVPLEDRHRSVALVSKHWLRLSRHERLLSTLEFQLPGHDMVKRARSIVAWLTKHAVGRVERLRVVTGFDMQGLGEYNSSHDTALEELLLALPALNTNAQLLDLAFDLNVPVPTFLPPHQLWGVMLSSVRRLHINCDLGGYIMMGAGMQGMLSLQDLRLDAPALKMQPMCRLPPRLTRLFLQGSIDCLSQQLGRLTHLKSLHLKIYGIYVFPSMAGLTALQRLEMERCRQLPPSLSELTQLDTLVLDRTPHGTDEEKTAALEAALPPLQHLTQLVLKGMPGVAPAALGALSRLQRFGVEGTENESQVLPRGAWLNSLREVALPPQVLAANLGVLSGAVALERVDVRSLFGASVLTQTAILRWVAEHPSVSRLAMSTAGAHCSEASFRAVVGAMQRKPSLAFDFGYRSSSDRLWPEPPAF